MKKILVVAMADSVHTARWLEQFENTKDEFVLFPSSPHRRIHPKIVKLLSTSSPMQISIPRGLSRSGLILAVLDKFFSNRLRGNLLRRVMDQLEPSILHALECQGAGYITSEALKTRKAKPFFVLTQWGSDFYWYQRFPRHRKKLETLLSKVDLLVMECERDVSISRSLGYTGKIFPPYPYTGGYEIRNSDELSGRITTSSRKIILIKGHTRFVGRGLLALQAIEELFDLLTNYKVIVYSADPPARSRANKLARQYGLKIVSFKRGELSHEETLDLFRAARIYVGISLSDAASISLLEAIVCGAFPIQTDTSCADEWIVNGKSGFIVSPKDHNGLVESIRTALEDDYLVDSAAQINYEVAHKRLDKSKILAISSNFYDSVSNSISNNKR
jgi:glycosyltransferase involved in cell wall biosynthesis